MMGNGEVVTGGQRGLSSTVAVGMKKGWQHSHSQRKSKGDQMGVKKEAKVKDAGTEDSSWGQCAWSFRAGV